MRIAFLSILVWLAAAGSVAAQAETRILTSEGRRPVACQAYEDYVRYMDYQAAKLVSAAGYERFVIQPGSFGGARSYNLIVEVFPVGFTPQAGLHVLSAREVLARPRAC